MQSRINEHHNDELTLIQQDPVVQTGYHKDRLIQIYDSVVQCWSKWPRAIASLRHNVLTDWMKALLNNR